MCKDVIAIAVNEGTGVGRLEYVVRLRSKGASVKGDEIGHHHVITAPRVLSEFGRYERKLY